MSEKKIVQQSYADSVAEKAAAAKGLAERVYANVISVLQPERYLCFLNLIERFHWYSHVNNLLILFQFPQAQYLAGYDVWKETALSTYNDPSRRVLKPSFTGKGIKLIAPFTVVEGDTRSLIHVAVPVYDINQMNELPRPENDFLDIRKCPYVDIINTINYVAPYRTVFASSDDKNLSYHVKGYCNHDRKHMVIDSRLSVRGLLATALHEFAVAEVYLSSYKNEMLHGLITESIFYVLCKHFNLSVEDITFSFVSRFKEASSSDIFEAFHMIQAISHSIIERMEEQLEFFAELNPVRDDSSYQTSFFNDIDFA